MASSKTDLNQNDITPEAQPREELIQTAITFLQNKNVLDSPLAQKQKFLLSKGLTDEEVRLACTRAGAYTLQEAQNRVPPPLPASTVLSMPHGHYYSNHIQKNWLTQTKDVLQSLAWFSAVAYAIYYFYKKFIRPFLFGMKKKSLDEQVTDLNKSITNSVKELKDEFTGLKTEVDKLNHTDSTTHQQLIDLKSEISTVKGLLLSRKQFPAVSGSPVVPPSIPAWQLSSVQPDADHKAEELIELGSGSGSSEEANTKNSDSSLEIM